MRLWPGIRAATAAALALALGTWLLPGSSGAGLPPGPGNLAGVVGASGQAAGVVGSGMLPGVLTADYRAAVNFPRTAVSFQRRPVAAHGFPARDLRLLPSGAVRPPAGYLMAPLEVLLPTSPFGLRHSPISGLPGDFHLGQDYAAACGTPVYAADSGVVRAAGWHPWGGGNRVEVDHGTGLVTTYNHLEASAVRAGDTVRAGQAIARVGSTGWSTGCHLHFETILNGRHANPLTWTLLPLSSLPGLPAARLGTPAWALAPGTGNSAPWEPWEGPPLAARTTTAPVPARTSVPSVAPPTPATPIASPEPEHSPPVPVPAEPPPAPVPAEPPPAPTEPAAPHDPMPTEPVPDEPVPSEPALQVPEPSEPVPAEPPPPGPPAGPAVPGKEASPSSAPTGPGRGHAAADVPARSTPDHGAAKCGQVIPSHDQYVELSVTNHQHGHLREDAACGIFVLDPADPE